MLVVFVPWVGFSSIPMASWSCSCGIVLRLLLEPHVGMIVTCDLQHARIHVGMSAGW